MSSILTRAHSWLVYAGAAYVSLLALLALEPVQRSLIYLHQIRFPFNAQFDRPDIYGFAPAKVLPFTLETPDGVVLGAWHVLPNTVYDTYVRKHGVPTSGALPQEVFDAALLSHPSIVYFHGNAATRAASNRIRVARYVSAQDTSLIIIDYRGFGDSEGEPSEVGLKMDARTVWDYVVRTKGALPSSVGIMGQSLGTGVATALAASLASEGTIPRALILVAPFSSIPSLLKTYKLAGFIPVLAPFRPIPGVLNAFLNLVLKTKFDTLSLIRDVPCPILILHALNDATIPYSHSATLFNHLLHHQSCLSNHTTTSSQLIFSSNPLVKISPAGSWGSIRTLSRLGMIEEGKSTGDVIWAEAEKGGHNDIGAHEYSMKLISKVMRTD